MKARLKSFITDNKFILITGAIATVIILIIYAYYSITPFGDRTILGFDLAAQYKPLLIEFYDKITSGSTFLYSWFTNLGGYYLGTYFNYLSSPLNLLILLFKRESIAEAIGFLVALRVVLSAMSMAYYLKKSQKGNDISIVAFGVMYAFCGYFFAYHSNIMWNDALCLLPLIVLGIEELMNGGKCTRYIATLALAIYSNYYIGFMLCIFSCIYFLYYYICSLHKLKAKNELSEEKVTLIEKIKSSYLFKSGVRFALSSLCVGLILSVMIIVLLNVLFSVSAVNIDKDTEFKFYFNIYDFIANHLTARTLVINFGVSDSYLPHIACGMLTVILFPVYLLSKEFKLSEKIGTILFVVFMFFSFNTSYLDALWHAGSLPNGFAYRQSFMYSFLLVIIAFKVFKNIDKIPKKIILISSSAVALFIASVWIFGAKNVNEWTPLISLVFTVLYTVVLLLICNKKFKMIILSSILAVTASAEVLTNIQPNYVPKAKSEVMYDYDEFKEIQADIKYDDDLLFYREEIVSERDTMISCLYGFNGISVFNSMTDTDMCKMHSELGIYSNSKFYSCDYYPQTPVYNAMFALKYIYDKDTSSRAGDYYTVKFYNNLFYAMKNNYALNIAYPVSEAIAEWNTSDYDNAVEAQEEYFRLATGVEGVYERTTNYEITSENVVGLENYEALKPEGKFVFERAPKTEKSSISIKITAEKTGNVYIYNKTEGLDFAYIDSHFIKKDYNMDPGILLDLGKYNEGETITIDYTISENVMSADMDFIVFTVNKDAFVEGYEKLKDGQLNYTEVDDTLIKGTFVAEENEILYTSIPYDKAWNVYVDGEKVDDEDVIAISGSLLGVKSISAGEHEIEFEYKNIGIGACVSIPIAVILVSAVLHVRKRKNQLVSENGNPSKKS